ncbi:MAG: class I SAM-dependent methyltransferase [Myxococcales bacterium]|nr:class I SAM-dependent methyltransferase [Myxococcales bacterium]
MADRFALQDAQYEFPYHYLPHLHEGHVRRSRSLRWGREYLCYLLFLVEKIRQLEPKTLLDVGCGDGRLLSLLVEVVPECHGVDLSPAAIRFARAFVPRASVAELDASQLSRTFEVVTAIEVLEHVPDPAVPAFLRTLAERCQPGGTVIVSVPTRNVQLTAKHYRHYDEALLRQHLKDSGAPLKVQELDYVYRQPTWLRTLERAIDNRHFRLEIGALDRLLWQHVWKHLRSASAADGHHLVATLRRS